MHAPGLMALRMPHAGDRVAVTCAGDCEVRVHDLTAGPAQEVYTCATVARMHTCTASVLSVGVWARVSGSVKGFPHSPDAAVVKPVDA